MSWEWSRESASRTTCPSSNTNLYLLLYTTRGAVITCWLWSPSPLLSSVDDGSNGHRGRRVLPLLCSRLNPDGRGRRRPGGETELGNKQADKWQVIMLPSTVGLQSCSPCFSFSIFLFYKLETKLQTWDYLLAGVHKLALIWFSSWAPHHPPQQVLLRWWPGLGKLLLHPGDVEPTEAKQPMQQHWELPAGPTATHDTQADSNLQPAMRITFLSPNWGQRPSLSLS